MTKKFFVLAFALFSSVVAGDSVHAQGLPPIDLSKAEIIVRPNQGVLAKAATLLQEEVEERTGLRLKIGTEASSPDVPTIHLRTADEKADQGSSNPPDKAEGYSISVDSSNPKAAKVHLVGRDERGALFAAGRLIRLLELGDRRIEMDPTIQISTAPDHPIRGHQIGYRETANTYDAWTLDTFEQYLRDLILFGVNSIELITSLDPEEFDGPVMTESQWDMNLKLAELIHSYGLEVWFWMPLDGDVTDPAIAQEELEARDRFFAKCAAIDHIMVPGGDPGRTTPAVLMPWLEKMAAVLHKHFPEAGIWVSNQKFEPEETKAFFDYLNDRRPDWLAGVVYGPGTLITIEETRQRTPKNYPIRRYPDITHCVRCEFPVPEWDRIWAQTLDREPPNPRPHDTAHTHNRFAEFSAGFVSYSDGAHDDLNKIIWSVLAWDSESQVDDILLDYGRVFFGEAVGARVAAGLRGLEENWRGPILENPSVEKTAGLWLGIEEAAGTAIDSNWRLQMYLFRALFDAHIQARQRAEMEYEKEAHAALSRAREMGAAEAVDAARAALAKADRIRIRRDLRFRLEELGVALYKSIGYQMSIDEPYRARNPERGALLDKVDRPLNDRPWLESEFDRILALADEAARLERIDMILNWENPGEGGFYDDLGNSTRQPRLVRQSTWEQDPGFITGPQESHYRSMNNETREIPPLKLSWLDQAETVYGLPLVLRYTDLDPAASYRVRVTYYGRYGDPMRLVADGRHEVHGPIRRSEPVEPVEFPIPREATVDGELELSWELVSGRGCQVAEVWLIQD